VVAQADLQPDELVVEIGAGGGSFTRVLASHPIDLIAVELDPVWCARLRETLRARGARRVRVVHADFARFRLPTRPFRVVGSLPFGRTTAILHRLLDDPRVPLTRADVVLQWEVARKRSSEPPRTRLSTGWAPWWRFALGERIPARAFRPVPAVDGGVLVVTRRAPPLLPEGMAPAYARFVAEAWPFEVHDRVRSPRLAGARPKRAAPRRSP